MGSKSFLAAGFLVSLCTSILSAFPVCSAAGQTAAAVPVPTQPAAQEPGLQRHPISIEDSQPDPHEQYLLGAGDDIVVTVAGRPELSGPHVVGPDGRITLPVVGTVAVGEKSRDDAARSIDESLGKYYSGSMSSTVEVTKYGSNHILLLGAIEKPGLITFDQPPTLLEAITKGGSVINPDKTIQSARKAIIYRGDNQVMNVNISERFDGRRALNDIRLRRNDTVYIPENQESLVSVLGEVLRPGPVRLDNNSTLISLLTSAGGITEKSGNNPTILITEPSTGRQQSIKFKELLTLHGGSDVTLHDGDIVYVPRSGLAKTGFIFSQIAPITGMATLATVTHQ
jgi:polysaccharide export outer membrane protein